MEQVGCRVAVTERAGRLAQLQGELQRVGELEAAADDERSILNQSITYVRSEVTGFKLAFGDTRTLLDCTQ